MAGNDPWDDDVEPASHNRDGVSGLDAFDDYALNIAGDDVHESPMALFTVTNPPGTVSATAAIGGRIRCIDIHDTSSFNEAQLADEIVTLAELAKEKAQAAQHAVTVELMRGLGHDRAGTSGYLQYSIGLPEPDAVSARMAEVFAARYPLRTD
jgi:hypothetical protein